MNLVHLHIGRYLDNYIKKSVNLFESIFKEIQNPDKEKDRKILIYIDRILDHLSNKNNNDFAYTHIHLEGIENIKIIRLICEYLIIRFFFIGLITTEENIEGNYIENKIKELKTELNSPNFPEGGRKVLNKVTNKYEPNRIYKEYIAKKDNLKMELYFYNKIFKEYNKCNIYPKTIFNLLQRDKDYFNEMFKAKHFGVDYNLLNDRLSYNILNADSIDTIKSKTINNEHFLKKVENIVLFDCDSKTSIFAGFNYENISNLNRNHNTKFKNLIVISFGRVEFKFYNVKNKLDRVNSRYNEKSNDRQSNTYTILPIEVKLLVNESISNSIPVEFYGDDVSTFWDSFQLISNLDSFENLYELRSIKMRNIYSLVFNESIKDMILEDLFSSDKQSKLISLDTWETIREMSKEDIDEIKGYLANTFDFIIQNRWLDKVKSNINENTTLLIPVQLSDRDVLFKEIKTVLELTNRNKLSNWIDTDINTERDTLILDYRDVGKFPYIISPSIFESYFSRTNQVKALYLSLFFKSNYEWSCYNLNKDLCDILNHPIRKQYFDWDYLKNAIKKTKPTKEKPNWDIENKYQNQQTRTVIKIKFKKSKRQYSFDPAELFIYKITDINKLKVTRLDEITEFDLDDIQIEIQQLDELHKDLNLYDKIANKEREESELRIIKNQFELDESDPGRLWKILLKRKVQDKGNESIYEDLKTFLSNKNLKIVSFYYFENNWIDPKSISLIPRNKKVFFELCQYLVLPLTYYRIMLRLKNVDKQSARKSTTQMNDLLLDLFNDGCFDDSSNPKGILEKKLDIYLKRHEFDEIGLAKDQVVNNLVALIEILNPLIKLRTAEKFEQN